MRDHRWLLIILCATIFTSLAFATPLARCPGVGVQSIRREASRYELAFIFYYTSWSNSSLEARKVYEQVADMFENQFHYFASIDCWHMSCNCSKTHEIGQGLPNTWPTLMISFARRIKFQYYGEWTRGDMIRFINRIYKPVDRLRTKFEAEQLLQEADSVILGVFPSPRVVEYKHFVVSVVQWMEVDPNFSFRFAVIFGDAGRVEHFPTSKSPNYVLMLRDRQIDLFDYNKGKWNNSNLIHWMHKELKRSFGNMTGYNSPATIALLSKRYPVIALFLNDMHVYTHFKFLLKDYRYTKDTYRKLPYPSMAVCKRIWKIPKAKDLCLAQYNNESFNHRLLDHSYLKDYYMWNLIYEKEWQKFVPPLPETDFYYYNVKTSKDLKRIYSTNLCFQENAQLITPQHKIRINKYWKRKSDLYYRMYHNRHSRNTSLAIVILNRYRYRDFVEKQGLFTNTKQNRSKPVIAIFDIFQESAYLMEDSFSISNVEKFMVGYYKGELRRFLAIAEPESFEDVLDDGETIFLLEYNTAMLQDAMTRQHYTMVVLFYGPYCSLSGVLAQTLTQIANFLKASKDDVRFIKFNVQTNAVPWNMDMPRTPAIIIFPKGRYQESRLYPAHVPADFQNLSAFIIAQLEPALQVKAILQSCKHFAQVRHLFVSCLEYSRTLVTQHISNFLKLWQIHETEREAIYSQLKSFKDLGAHIQESFRY